MAAGMTPSPIAERLLREFESKQSWLMHDSHWHGVDHMTRVFILQELICVQLEREGIVIDRRAVRFAAMVHDVGRVDDGVDPDHGWRSAEWMKHHLANRILPETMDRATYAVHWHVPPDQAAPVMTPELMVLKDADGLDRVRLGDLDVARLRTDVAKQLLLTAEELYYESVRRSPDGDKATFLSVLEAATALGLVRE